MPKPSLISEVPNLVLGNYLSAQWLFLVSCLGDTSSAWDLGTTNLVLLHAKHILSPQSLLILKLLLMMGNKMIEQNGV